MTAKKKTTSSREKFTIESNMSAHFFERETICETFDDSLVGMYFARLIITQTCDTLAVVMNNKSLM